ncbi:MAG: threonine dehydratase [Myxococcales bacterium]|nr:MAG: threonine dehydratase [Myxococcales bacterium]
MLRWGAVTEKVSFVDVLKAWPVVRGYLPKTPLYRYANLSSRWGLDAYVKHENHMPIGAFKVRGGINLFANLSDAERARGVVTATRGNHGLSIAYAARAFGSRAVIFVPRGNNPEKNAGMEALGAKLVEYGRDFDEAREEAEAYSKNEHMRYVHPANEALLIAGSGTYAVEIIQELPEVDVIIVPMGGGSGASGVVLSVQALKPSVKVIGVQSERAPALAKSIATGTLQETEQADTFADGLATRVAFELPLSILQGKLDRVVLLSEEEMRQGVKLALEMTHNPAEGAAAAVYAAADKLRQELRGKKVVLIHSGHNIDRNTLRWALGLYDC